jgi:nucleoside-diphosphate-sugar epimerase
MVTHRHSNPEFSKAKASLDLSQKRPILVTGAAGFVGFHVVQELHKIGEKVVAVDSLASGLYSAREKLERFWDLKALSGVDAVKLDLNDWEKMGALEEIHEVKGTIHLAAMPGLRLSWDSLPLYSKSNIDATGSALEISAIKGGKRFLHISTSSVYGVQAKGIGQETAPASPYGITKLAAEQLVSVMSPNLGLDYSIVRLFSVYGPQQRPDMAYRRFIEAAYKGKPVPLFGDGSQSRTNTYVEDVAVGIVNAFFAGKSHSIYDIGGGEEIRILEAIAIIEELTGKKVPLVREPAVRGDQIYTKAYLDPAKRDFGFKNGTTLREGLALQAEWIAKNLF